MPPFFGFPILWITFPLLVWLIDGAVSESRRGRIRRIGPAFLIGWWFGFGYFLGGLWWVGNAFLVEADQFAWAMPLAVLLLPAGLAVFWGCGTALARLVWSEDWRRVLALAAGLGGAEWLRGHLFSGFPWNAIGYALTAGEILMQSASLFGLYALNVVAVAIFAAPAALAPKLGERRRNVALPALSLAAIAALGFYGVLRLSEASNALVPDVTIRIVQPALPQLQKWDPESKDAVLSTYYRLSAPEGAPLAPGTILVWPESAFPFPLTQDAGVFAAIAEMLPPDTALVTGAYREEYGPRVERTSVYNSIYAIGEDGAVLDAYDKTHLVPFGEYLPAGAFLERFGLSQLAPSSFSAGTLRRPISLPFGPSFLPLICYEAIFSGRLLAGGERPAFLLNLTNDGWFGRTIGPYQHFHQARIRSVEEGLPLIRAANTGISAIIDAYGRAVAVTRLGDSTMIEGRLPAAIPPPVYAQWQRAMFLLSMAVCLLLALTKFLYRGSSV